MKTNKGPQRPRSDPAFPLEGRPGFLYAYGSSCAPSAPAGRDQMQPQQRQPAQGRKTARERGPCCAFKGKGNIKTRPRPKSPQRALQRPTAQSAKIGAAKGHRLRNRQQDAQEAGRAHRLRLSPARSCAPSAAARPAAPARPRVQFEHRQPQRWKTAAAPICGP